MIRIRRTRARSRVLLPVAVICVGVVAGLFWEYQGTGGARTRAETDRDTPFAVQREMSELRQDTLPADGTAPRDSGASTGPLAELLKLRRDPDPARAPDLKELRRDLPDTPEALGAYALAAAGMAERAEDKDLKHDLLLTALDAQLETLTRHRAALAAWDWENARAVFEKLAAALPDWSTQPGCATRMIPIRDVVGEELRAAANGAHTAAEAAEVSLVAVLLGLGG